MLSTCQCIDVIRDVIAAQVDLPCVIAEPKKNLM